MIVGTLFTLFVLPSIYMLIARDRGAEEAEADEDDLLGEAELEPVGA
jgi:hypothetical protein